MTRPIGLLTLIGALAACGRVGFDAHAVGGDGGPPDADPDALDAAPLTDAPDAVVPCAPAGNDEDLDGVDDACDLCPHLPGPQVDGDGDGVGDDCDPEPALARQRIARFDTFQSLTSPWTPQGTSVLSDGELQIGNGTGGASISRPWVPGDSVFVIGYEVETPTNSGALISIDAGESTSNRLYYCELYDDLVNTALQLTYTLNGTDFAHTSTLTSSQRIDNVSGTLAFRTATTQECTARVGAATSNVAGPTPVGITPDVLAVYSQDVLLRVAWMIEIRTE